MTRDQALAAIRAACAARIVPEFMAEEYKNPYWGLVCAAIKPERETTYEFFSSSGEKHSWIPKSPLSAQPTPTLLALAGILSGGNEGEC